jgi:hypothetical protein
LPVLSTGTAFAHVDVRPRLVQQGATVDLVVELPALRPGGPPERLEVTGPGLETVSTRLQELVGRETRWSVRLRANAEPGRVPLVLRAVFPDGRSVRVGEALTVVPAPDAGNGFPVAAAAAGVVVALALAAAVLGVARRRRPW